MFSLPLTSMLIAAGLLLLSIAIVGFLNPKIGKRTRWVCLVFGCAIFGVGLSLHLASEPPPPAPKASLPAPKSHAPRAAAFSFTFAPETARWGEEVRISTVPAQTTVIVYLNDRPIPSRPLGDGVLVITIPSASKSGYLAVESGGQRVRADREFTVTGP